MKKLLAIILSIAILVMAFPFSVFAVTPSVATDTWDGTFTEPTETDADGNIIINTAEEMAWVALRAGEATTDKNYKVADGIESFDMNGSVGITANSTAADVKSATATGNNWNYESDGRTGKFMGNFNGNGVTIYNIRTVKHGYAGLFPFVYNDVTIENVTIKASYFAAYHNSAAFVGSGELQKTININKCAVENCYITDNGESSVACKRAAAAFVAATGNSNVNIANCFAANNEYSATGYEAGFVAVSGDYIPTGISIKNSISIGMTPYSVSKLGGALGKGLTEKLTIENVYSDVACDAEGFTTLTTDKMQGAAAKDNMALAWNTHWVTGDEGEYPSIHYGEPIVDPYLWDGSFVEPTETDADGNIIINKASEMAWVALRGGESTTGKNYKVADGIKYFDMNGSVGITANSTAAEVKEATATGNNWNYTGDGKIAPFYGNFDGNGVTIYNIRTLKYGQGALFPYVLNESTIKNVSVKASYIAGYHNAAGLVGTGELQKTITFDKCSVENCYLNDGNDQNAACSRAAAGIISSTGNSNAKISNCLVANNIFSTAGYEAGFVAKTGNYAPKGVEITNSIAIGVTPYSTSKLGGDLGKGLTEQLNVSNVYSDVACDISGFTILTKEQMQGAAAKENIALNWDITWKAGAEGEYPSIIFDSSFYDEWDGTFVEPTKIDEAGNIIIKSAEEMAWVALRGDAATEGKSYKVADGIKYFNMNGMSGISFNSTATEVKAATATGNNWSYAADGKVGKFMGNFNGNGVTIYNIRTAKYAYAGLFPFVYNDVTIENVTIKASYFVAYHNSAAIVGSGELQKTINVNKCAVENCYLTDGNDQNPACQRAAAAFVAATGNSNLNIANCFAANNEYLAAGYEAGFVAISGNYIPTGISIKNSISIGIAPSSISKLGGALGSGLTEKLTIENVYSDVACDIAGVKTLTTAQMQGAAAKENIAFNWDITWKAGAEGEYPSIIFDSSFYDEWDGTFVEPTKTDADGNIVITSAEEMAWIALRGDTATDGKSYKVADGIKYFNMNGMSGITFDSTVADVKAADKNEAFAWRYAADNQTGTFYGNFDGNGVTIYNMYSSTGRGYAGLFPVINPKNVASLTIKNVTVLASSLGAYHNAGAIIGQANAPDTSRSITLENCAVKNCYLSDNNDTNAACQRTVGALVGQLTHNASTINNCLVADNEISAQGIIGGLFGNVSAFAQPSTISNVVSIGTSVQPLSVSYDISARVENIIYSNVYTDLPASADGITVLTADQMKGVTALENMSALDSAVWFFNTTSYPELYKFHNVVDGICDCGLIKAEGSTGDECVHIAGNAVEENRIDATCSLEGSYDMVVYCTECGTELSRETFTIEKLAHTAGEAAEENRIEATCVAEGSYDSVVYCSVCGEEISRTTETIAIDENAHAFDDENDTECNNGCGYSILVYGDVNGDGKVNAKDCALVVQHVTGWDVKLNLTAADVNGDGEVNAKDYALMIQFINGWDVVLG